MPGAAHSGARKHAGMRTRRPVGTLARSSIVHRRSPKRRTTGDRVRSAGSCSPAITGHGGARRSAVTRMRKPTRKPTIKPIIGRRRASGRSHVRSAANCFAPITVLSTARMNADKRASGSNSVTTIVSIESAGNSRQSVHSAGDCSTAVAGPRGALINVARSMIGISRMSARRSAAKRGTSRRRVCSAGISSTGQRGA